MKTLKLTILASALGGVFVLTPMGVRAAIIVEPFTITVSPPLALATFPAFNSVLSTTLPQFNPSSGTLNSIDVTLTGSATWTHPPVIGPQELEAELLLDSTNIAISDLQDFTSPGTITLNLSGNANDSGTGGAVSGLFVGTGTVQESIFLLTPDTGDTFATIAGAPLMGSVTYNFTPAAVVPEPTTLALLGTGLLGLSFIRRRRAK